MDIYMFIYIDKCIYIYIYIYIYILYSEDGKSVIFIY